MSNLTSPSDVEEKAGFDAGILSHLDALYGVALRLTKNPARAEDLVQDTVVKAVRGRRQFLIGTNLKAWLMRILTNTFINHHRRGNLEREVLGTATAAPLVHRWTGAATLRALRDPTREALAPLVEAEVQRALADLPDHFRVPIVLSDIEGLSYKEIAEVMDCPVGTVMSRLHRARHMLQASLQEHAVLLGIIPDPASMPPPAGSGEKHKDDRSSVVPIDDYRKRAGGGS